MAAAAPRRTGRTRRSGTGLTVVAVLVLLYLFLPIIWIVAFSFNQPVGRFNLIWNAFTLDNWADPFAKPDLTDAFVRSLVVATLAAGIATALGSLMALAMTRYRFRGSGAVNLFLVLPLTTPEIILGSSLATLFVTRGIERGFVTVVIAHILFCLSYVALTVKARLRGFDWSLEDAAMDLGARPLRVFARVTLPLMAPGILAAFLLSFALSLDDFLVTLFTAGSDYTTFPIEVWTSSRAEISPQVNVLATMVLVSGVALMTLGSVLKARREGRALVPPKQP
jgi:spermidine/putrescine transport system permease protein